MIFAYKVLFARRLFERLIRNMKDFYFNVYCFYIVVLISNAKDT